MEERVRQFEESLRLISSSKGTTVAVKLPLNPSPGKTFIEDLAS